MAEILLKIGDQGPLNTDYKNNDNICAFNDRRIYAVHAEHICHIKKCPMNHDGLNISGSLSEKMRMRCQQYRFERISVKEVMRINQWTLEEDIFSDKPNAKGEMILVDEYIRRRKRHARHCIFGTEGSEVWYGGRIDFSMSRINTVWNDIETDSFHRKADHTLFPLGTEDVKVHLAVKTTLDFDDAKAEEFVEQEVIYDNKDDPTAGATVVRKRRRYIDIASLPLSEMKITMEDVTSKTKALDVREERPITFETRVLTKTIQKGKNRSSLTEAI